MGKIITTTCWAGYTRTAKCENLSSFQQEVLKMSPCADVAASDLIFLQHSYNLFDLLATRKLFLIMSFVGVTLGDYFLLHIASQTLSCGTGRLLQQERCCAVSSGVCMNLRMNSAQETNGSGPSVLLQKKALRFLPSDAKPSPCMALSFCAI